MGVGFVLAAWLLLGLAAAAIASRALRSAASSLTRRNVDPRDQAARTRLLRTAYRLPFYCLAWAVGVFVFQAVINSFFLHRDIGVGDSATCPLPNGYAILLIDVGDRGTVYNPRTQQDESSVIDREDHVDGVRLLQVANAMLLGGAAEYSRDFDAHDPPIDRWFLLDTQSGKRSDFSSEGKLRLAARARGVELTLEPISSIYNRYRYTWFDLAAALLLVMPMLIGVVRLMRSIARQRRGPGTPLGGLAVPEIEPAP